MDDPAEIADGPCTKCDDSGYIETCHGGFWTGEGMSSSMSICDCICGEDVRRERAAQHLKDQPQ